MLISDHPSAPDPSPSADGCPRWTDVLGDQDLAAGGRCFARHGGHEIALFRIQGAVYAIADSCPHAGASLASGELEGATIRCPAHGLRFDLVTGYARGGGFAMRIYPVRVHEGRVEVDLGATAR
ncbi:Rieske (2Fe-2S) protein [Variovorax ginsengisoli]|uniref:Nitrite reductase (NAD(P)H) small subunit n=1 Tax=Variovorax ginsengisoli TaxID=363844 RepID=A0ABT8SFP0_9BURK|nr:Rieske 2Fe-2S domain-containing protein [Variovorax ginsengisoli]MDN8618575.1 nitrite reductase (NAD(P)H) small subunit [Variovorax ginsengisoli]MDO1537745.1 nitrite reductase (NAD(P)H) small subunit [Variovorax ginsengisoli]